MKNLTPMNDPLDRITSWAMTPTAPVVPMMPGNIPSSIDLSTYHPPKTYFSGSCTAMSNPSYIRGQRKAQRKFEKVKPRLDSLREKQNTTFSHGFKIRKPPVKISQRGTNVAQPPPTGPVIDTLDALSGTAKPYSPGVEQDDESVEKVKSPASQNGDKFKAVPWNEDGKPEEPSNEMSPDVRPAMRPKLDEIS